MIGRLGLAEDHGAGASPLEELCNLRARVEKLLSAHWNAVLGFAIESSVPSDDLLGRRQIKGFANLSLIERAPHSHVSLASTATCVRSLKTCTEMSWAQLDLSQLADEIRSRYQARRLTTTGLAHLNPFTIGQLGPILRHVGISRDEEVATAIATKLTELTAERGVSIGEFPPNSYLSYWVLAAARALDLDVASTSPLVAWSRSQLDRHLALLTAGDDEEGEAFQLAYSLVIQAAFDPKALRPAIASAALAALADSQLPRGLWEKKEPLFVWQQHGDAYCFSYELLSTLLVEFRDRYPQLAPFEPALERSLLWAERNAHIDGAGQASWRSGHRTENSSPESWATAEVYTFLRYYLHYLTFRINAALLAKYRGGATPAAPDPQAFRLFYQPEVRSPSNATRVNQPKLSDVLTDYVLSPLRLDADTREYSLSRNTGPQHRLRSVILFGPPGSGKTSIVKAIAKYLGWPLIVLDPSNFAAEGLHLLPTTIGKIFNDLREARDTVILLDEMEDLMRNRQSEILAGRGETTFEQRLLTTAILPRLEDLHSSAHSLIFVVTNHFARIDESARRFGRFDMAIEVLPACFEEKCRQILDGLAVIAGEPGAVLPEGVSRDMEAALREVADDGTRLEDRQKLEWATFGEVRQIVRVIREEAGNGALASEILATLLRGFRPSLTIEDWRDGNQYNKLGISY
ncbi:MAG TPA: ATP-binding protein [Streptosporangiaceae bacterium]|nr:ATP-binding protein [Streptosporangiaceae bacterium]